MRTSRHLPDLLAMCPRVLRVPGFTMHIVYWQLSQVQLYYLLQLPRWILLQCYFQHVHDVSTARLFSLSQCCVLPVHHGYFLESSYCHMRILCCWLWCMCKSFILFGVWWWLFYAEWTMSALRCRMWLMHSYFHELRVLCFWILSAEWKWILYSMPSLLSQLYEPTDLLKLSQWSVLK